MWPNRSSLTGFLDEKLLHIVGIIPCHVQCSELLAVHLGHPTVRRVALYFV